MKKIYFSFLIILALFLVACDSTGSSTVDIEKVSITSNVFEADLKLMVEYETSAERDELITSAVNLAFNQYKEDFGTRLFTLYFTIYEKDSDTPLGVVAYKVNSSVSNPGLTFVGDDLN